HALGSQELLRFGLRPEPPGVLPHDHVAGHLRSGWKRKGGGVMAGRVILIEGLDLAGKTTLVRNLQAELTRRGIPVRVSRNALCPDNPIAALADQVRRDPHAGLVETGALFLAAHLWDARHFT